MILGSIRESNLEIFWILIIFFQVLLLDCIFVRFGMLFSSFTGGPTLNPYQFLLYESQVGTFCSDERW